MNWEEGRVLYPYRVPLEPVVECSGAEAPAMRDLVPVLGFIVKKERWQAYLVGTPANAGRPLPQRTPREPWGFPGSGVVGAERLLWLGGFAGSLRPCGLGCFCGSSGPGGRASCWAGAVGGPHPRGLGAAGPAGAG